MQKRIWEGMVVPVGRVPHPSILRSHPKTEYRVERLMALKQTPQRVEEIAAGKIARDQIIPDALRQQIPRKPSPVPKISRKWGRGEGAKYAQYASLLNANTVEPIRKKSSQDKAASETSLNAASNNPKIRLSRGGVWW